jgi:very-short-patch-repair endonuclease
VEVFQVLRVTEGGTREIARVAGIQRGRIERSQLVAAGLTRWGVRRLITNGWLHPRLPGVYAVGHASDGPLTTEMEAALYVGHDFAISHRSAGAMWGLCPADPDRAEVTVIGRDVVRRARLRTYRVAALDSRDVRLRHGLPVTAPARTLIDRAGEISPDQLDRELNEARVLNLITDAELYAAIDRCPGRTGVGPLRALLATQRGPALTRSEAERRFKHIIEHGQLPWPRFNVYLHHKQVDLLWPDLQLIVEVDGYATHSTRTAFERDRARDQHLAAHGYTTIRITWRQLTQQPMAVLANLAHAIARAQALRGL